MDIGEVRAESVIVKEVLEALVPVSDGEFGEFLIEWLEVVKIITLHDVADDRFSAPVVGLDGENLSVDDLSLGGALLVVVVLRREVESRIVVHLEVLVLGEELEIDLVLVEGTVLGAPVGDLDFEALEFRVLGGDERNGGVAESLEGALKDLTGLDAFFELILVHVDLESLLVLLVAWVEDL